MLWALIRDTIRKLGPWKSLGGFFAVVLVVLLVILATSGNDEDKKENEDGNGETAQADGGASADTAPTEAVPADALPTSGGSSSGPDCPTSPREEVDKPFELAGSTDSSLYGAGVENAYWDPTINLISFQREATKKDPSSFGMNIWLGPIRENSAKGGTGPRSSGECVASVLTADLATADEQCCDPREMNVRTYVMSDDADECEVQIYSVTRSRITGLLTGCPVLKEVDIFGNVGETVRLNAFFNAAER